MGVPSPLCLAVALLLLLAPGGPASATLIGDEVQCGVVEAGSMSCEPAQAIVVAGSDPEFRMAHQTGATVYTVNVDALTVLIEFPVFIELGWSGQLVLSDLDPGAEILGATLLEATGFDVPITQDDLETTASTLTVRTDGTKSRPGARALIQLEIVPEPTTATLVALGLAALAHRRRRS